MITLSVIFTIYVLISTYRIYKRCKVKGVKFNLFEGKGYEFMPILIALLIIFAMLITLSVNYLP